MKDGKGRVAPEQGGGTEGNGTDHAETTRKEAASKRFAKEEWWSMTIYTTVEPGAMRAGTIDWGNAGRGGYGVPEKRPLEPTGDDERTPTLDLSRRDAFARGRKPIAVGGPFPAIGDGVRAAPAGDGS